MQQKKNDFQVGMPSQKNAQKIYRGNLMNRFLIFIDYPMTPHIQKMLNDHQRSHIHQTVGNARPGSFFRNLFPGQKLRIQRENSQKYFHLQILSRTRRCLFTCKFCYFLD